MPNLFQYLSLICCKIHVLLIIATGCLTISYYSYDSFRQISLVVSKPPRTKVRGYLREVLTGLKLIIVESRQGLFDNSTRF